MIASRRTGIEHDLTTIFPGCKVVEWAPLPKRISGYQKRAYDLIRNWFKSKKDDLPLAEVRNWLKVERYNLDVSDDLESMLESEGIFYFTRRGRQGSYFSLLDLS